jgi:hypothetical protein
MRCASGAHHRSRHPRRTSDNCPKTDRNGERPRRGNRTIGRGTLDAKVGRRIAGFPECPTSSRSVTACAFITNELSRRRTDLTCGSPARTDCGTATSRREPGARPAFCSPSLRSTRPRLVQASRTDGPRLKRWFLGLKHLDQKGDWAKPQATAAGDHLRNIVTAKLAGFVAATVRGRHEVAEGLSNAPQVCGR